ncbi:MULTISPECIES: aldo/keto reductase [unclassified Roseateles]|uniref:aldo/keto reductase n=1 Tax=unclassified Roseateles TaxID=2626991 RepID=UPI0006F2D7A2|nr:MULTISPECIES: aldo/keto reductase [unclassified Roseateles]KQW44643.1 aldo/keto reductase [Pelomonas sp. Root405]KRA70002.1 aldo/keto reductase [Pelomonas sp. Root662]
MIYRPLGRTGWNISAIGFGAWAIGGTWGNTDDTAAMAALHRALDRGVNFFDTADVYGDGHSERLLARLRRERPNDAFYVATKAGRRLSPHAAEGYRDLRPFIERSLQNLETEAIDLLQLHCPPSAVYGMPEVFGALDDLVREGKLRHYGVSVERIDEAMAALKFPGVQSVQIIYNLFRQRPAEVFLPAAQAAQVGVLARLPLSSGMLSGKFTRESSFGSDDHRGFNRQGEAFDKGETFSGVDFEQGLAAVEELRALLPSGVSMARLALRWILMNDGITTAIPGGRTPAQVDENVSAADLAALPAPLMASLADVYQRRIAPQVHHLW